MRTALVMATASMLALGACVADEGSPEPSEARSAGPSANATERAGTEEFDPTAVELELEPFAEGFEAPLLLTHAGDDDDRLYVVEQGGTVRIIEEGAPSAEPFLDISHLTEGGGEQGLFGLAFHPDYERGGRFFVNYTDLAGDTIVASYSGSGGTADPDSGQVLLKIDQPYSNHNGGHLEFGRDGYLYIATGDGGGGGDPEENGQNLDSLLGKLLRIDVDRGDPYGIPADNPFADGGGAPEIWAYGLRNPWRFSFDDTSGTLWIGDVGQGELEEIDRVPADEGGLNFGWNEMEGSSCYAGGDCDPSGMVLPVTEYGHDQGCSITGGFVYRGEASPALRGGYYFTDYCSGHIWGIDAAADEPVEPTLLASTERALSSFGKDADGELYVTDIGAGAIFRLVGSER